MVNKSSDTFKILLASLVIIACTAAVYSNSVKAPFVFDDFVSIRNNPHIRVQEISLSKMVSASLDASPTRPVAAMTFILNYMIHGYDPVGYHVFNIMVHAANGIFLFLLIRATLKRGEMFASPNRATLFAFLSSLLWLLHPVHTQSVTYIVQRMNSLAALFMLVSLWCYINGRTAQNGYRVWLWFSGSFASWLLALGCKENSVVLPVLMFIYEWFFFQDLSWTWLRRQLKWIGVAAVVSALATALLLGSDPMDRIGSLRDFSESRFTYLERVLTQPRVVMHYVLLFVLPHPSRLNFDYDFPLSHGIFDPPTTLLAIVAIAALMAIGIIVARRHRLLAFAIFWFFATLVVESSVIPLAIIFEHRTYLPYMALAPMVVWAVFRIPGPKALPVLLLVVISALFFAWTWQRNTVWTNPERLWSDVIAKSPEKARPYQNLGQVLEQNGKADAAEDQFRKAIQLDPDFVEAINSLGLNLANKGQTVSAETLYKRAIEISPDYFSAYNNYGVLMIAQGRPEEGLRYLEEARQLAPDSPAVVANIGIAWLELGQPNKAESILRDAIEKNPENLDARIALSRTMIKKESYDVAINQLNQIINRHPDDIRAHELLLDAILKKGDAGMLEPQLKRLLALDPDNVEANTNMGAILIGRGDIDGAVYRLQKVLDQDPAHAEALSNMGIALASKGQYADAGDAFLAAIRSRPEFTDAWENLFHLGRVAGARWDMADALRRHTEDHPDNPESYVILGEFYLRRGESTLAISAFERALDLDPDNARAQKRLSTIN